MMTSKQEITGILLLDKESGYTSNTALQRVKKYLGAKKAGHTGTLDPLASGMLPICLGEATKVVRFLLDADKKYQVKIALGHTMTTADADGALLLSRAIPHLSTQEIESIIEQFRGPILQLPPIYSALKQKGKRFCDLAREGKSADIERKARSLHIHELTLDKYDYQDQKTAFLSLTVKCSKGTYIRSLAEDIGEKMGCGAHVLELRRVFVEPFEKYPMLTMMQLDELYQSDSLNSILLKPEQAIPHIQKMHVSKDNYSELYQGKQISCKADMSLGWVQLWSDVLEKFFGIGEVLVSGLIAPRRLFKIV